MYVNAEYSDSDTGENEIYEFDFVYDCVAGESVSSATWFCTVATGTDASASTRVTGSAMISGTKTSQRFSGLLPGVKYCLTAQVLTNLGNVKKLWSHVTVRTPG